MVFPNFSLNMDTFQKYCTSFMFLYFIEKSCWNGYAVFPTEKIIGGFPHNESRLQIFLYHKKPLFDAYTIMIFLCLTYVKLKLEEVVPVRDRALHGQFF